jgi:anti-sigma factor RsiW
MMNHEEDGRLMAYLDGELSATDAGALEAHLGSCADCKESASRLRAESGRVREALPELDVDATGATRRVRERLAQHAREIPAVAPSRTPLRTSHPARRPSWIRRSRVLQAALFVLFVAGGASAVVPGSPLHRWLMGGGPETDPTASTPALMRAPAAESTAEQPQQSLSAQPAGGRLRVSLQLPAGTELSVVFVDGERATVHANADTNFLTADGLLQARVVSGPVRVELPRGAADVSLEVGSEPYLRMQNGQVTFREPVADSSDAEFKFRIR